MPSNFDAYERMWDLWIRAVDRYELEGVSGLLGNLAHFLTRAARIHLLGVHVVTEHLLGIVTRDDLRSHESAMEFSESATVSVTPPISGSREPPRRLRRFLGEYDLKRPFVVELPDVRLIGEKAIPMVEGGVILDAFSGRRDRFERHLVSTPRDLFLALADRYAPRDGEFRDIDVACSFASVGPGYCGWIQSVLTRLPGLAHYESVTGRRPTIILPPDPPSWKVESIEFFGYDDWIEWDGTPTRVESFIVPSVQTGEYTGSVYAAELSHDDALRVVHPAACQWLRERASERTPPSEDPTPDRVYISRERAEHRRVVNRDELYPVLTDHGIEPIVMESMEFSEQVRTMAGADLLIGPSGAGLVNSTFTQDATVIELFGADSKATFFLLSASTGNEYRYVRCEEESRGLVADVAAIESVLK